MMQTILSRRFAVAVLTLAIALAGCAHASNVSPLAEGCDMNPALQGEMSTELLRIVKEDQADRSGPYDSIDFARVNPRDLARRIKVARLFAEGCFKSASDYASAALVFQHGTTADHFYQAFLWALQAVKLGDNSQRWLV